MNLKRACDIDEDHLALQAANDVGRMIRHDDIMIDDSDEAAAMRPRASAVIMLTLRTKPQRSIFSVGDNAGCNGVST